MSDKSYVALEQKICYICSRKYDTGDLLLDQKLRNKFEMHEVTGMGKCKDCVEKTGDNYIAAVVSEDVTPGQALLKNKDAERTGEIYWLRKEVFFTIFDVNQDDIKEMVFIDSGVAEKLKELNPEKK